MPELRTITVPPAEEFLTRLRAIDDDPHMGAFYASLMEAAGQKRAGIGIANRLVLSMADYTAGFPPAVTRTVAMRLHEFVPAFTDDPQAQTEALDHLKASGFPDGRP